MNPITLRNPPLGPPFITRRALVLDYFEQSPITFYFNPGTRCHHLTLGGSPVHRVGGPALVTARGLELWVQNGTLHREDGPAWLAPGGYDRWLRRGKMHREDGPAQIGPTGYRKYWLSGVPINRSNYEVLMTLEPDMRDWVLKQSNKEGWKQSDLRPFLDAASAAVHSVPPR